MNEQPEALRLADELENGECFDVGSCDVAYGWLRNDPTSEAADELRRLHEENERLRKTAMLTLCTLSCKYEIKHAVKAEREACAKVCDEIERGPAMMIEERHTARQCAAAIRARGET